MPHSNAASRPLQAAQELASVAAQVSARLEACGLEACCSRDEVAHALLPLPDVPYLHCVAQLPKPGANLRPASGAIEVKKAAGKKEGGKKKKGGKKKAK
jgi:hypothetical protein